jgi:hypothetical protein
MITFTVKVGCDQPGCHASLTAEVGEAEAQLPIILAVASHWRVRVVRAASGHELEILCPACAPLRRPAAVGVVE